MRNLIVSAPRMLALLGAVLFIGATAQASQTHKETGVSAKAAHQSYLWLKMKTNKRTILRTILKKTQKINCN